MKKYRFYLLAFLLLLSLKIDAQLAAIWDTPTTGTLDGISFSLTNLISASTQDADITGPDFTAAPLSSNQPSLDYQGNSNWTITFASPVTGLRLYARWWRMYTYIFDHEFTILSGSGFTTNEDTLFVSDTWGNGIIEFQDTLTELTLTTDQICCANQALNFGLTPPCANTTNTIDTTTCGSYISHKHKVYVGTK